MNWNPDCTGEPCECPGTERGTVLRPRAKVVLFKPGGKYYTEEEWLIPTVDEVLAGGGSRGDSAIPYCMRFSPDFRRISGGPVLVETQEPWGYPHLLPVDGLNPRCSVHNLVQHRDGKRPWCNECGRAADGRLIGRPKLKPSNGQAKDEASAREALETIATDEGWSMTKALEGAWAWGYAAAGRDALDRPYSDHPAAATWQPTPNPYA